MTIEKKKKRAVFDYCSLWSYFCIAFSRKTVLLQCSLQPVYKTRPKLRALQNTTGSELCSNPVVHVMHRSHYLDDVNAA